MHGHYASWRSWSEVRRYNTADTDLLCSLEEWFLIHHSDHKGEENFDALKKGFYLLWRLRDVSDADLSTSVLKLLIDRFFD